MKILILSDSHGSTKLMEDVVAKHENHIECAIFLGDYLEDCKKIATKFSNTTFHMVPGNCDYYSDLPGDLTIKIGGKRIWISHGHKASVKSGYDEIVNLAIVGRADICLFGHTHEAVAFEKNGILFLNPGSISQPRGVKGKSYAIIEILEGAVFPKIIEALR